MYRSDCSLRVRGDYIFPLAEISISHRGSVSNLTIKKQVKNMCGLFLKLLGKCNKDEKIQLIVIFILVGIFICMGLSHYPPDEITYSFLCLTPFLCIGGGFALGAVSFAHFDSEDEEILKNLKVSDAIGILFDVMVFIIVYLVFITMAMYIFMR